jgi:hypothetical protein
METLSAQEQEQRQAEQYRREQEPGYAQQSVQQQEQSKAKQSVQDQQKNKYQSDVHDVAEAEMKRKGLKTMDQLNDMSAFVPISFEDQQYLHANDTVEWKKLRETIRDRKRAASDKARELDLAKQEEELKLLKVKRYTEAKAKPDFLCVVSGCGEEKAPGQGFHCASHSKGS